MTNLNFTCPYCSQHTTITGPNYYENWNYLSLEESHLGKTGYKVIAITCPNINCQKLYLQFILTQTDIEYGNYLESDLIQKWQLLPESEAKVMPDYIPKPITQDYYEACRIRDLSPKASATLARRCLQGMIRDFFGFSKSRLIDEITAIEDKVDSEVYAAIDAVRSVGNIGAHMEQDINLIVDVDPKEAQLLIELIEQLVDDWYVDRKIKQERLLKITDMAGLKQLSKKKRK